MARWGEVLPPAETRQLCPAQGSCSCMFPGCGCFTEDELASGAVTVLGCMRGTAKTAQHGYRSPESHPGRVLFFRVSPSPGKLATAPLCLPRELKRVGHAPHAGRA